MLSGWGEADIPPLVGKTVLVTGANSGIGLAAAKIFADHGARVLLACRNASRAQAAVDEIRAEATGPVDVEIVALDLAGLMAVDQSKTEDGFEMQFGVNHLGHFALTAELSPLLLSTYRSRIVTMSSMGHRVGRLRLDDLFFQRRGYDRWRPYFQSKLANLLFTSELQHRLATAGASTIGLSAHPGASDTDISTGGTGVANGAFRVAAQRIQPIIPLAQSARLGALPALRAAVDPKARGGEFYGPRWLIRGSPRIETPSRRARDTDSAVRLWQRSEELTGISFDM